MHVVCIKQGMLHVNDPGTWLVATTGKKGPMLLFDLVHYRLHQTIHARDLDAKNYLDFVNAMVTSDGHHVLLSVVGPPPRYKDTEHVADVTYFATWDVQKGLNVHYLLVFNM
jgi:hypothetical protein